MNIYNKIITKKNLGYYSLQMIQYLNKKLKINNWYLDMIKMNLNYNY